MALLSGAVKDHKITAPVTTMQIVVTIDQLRPFKWNPRTSKNPRYDEIKASIKAVGLDHTPNITQIPGDDKFTIRDGGNTRLLILHELWEETGDEKFFQIKCVFKPFTNNISMIVGHLSENDNRGDLKWIERANALKVAKDAYLEIDKIDDISTRDLVKRLEGDGYKISRSHVVKMFQTINHILPSLPDLLMAGMGRPQVEKILSFRQASKAIWDCCSLPDDDFNEEFHNILCQFDTDENETLPFDAIHDSILGMFVSKTNAHYNVLQLTFDLIMNAKSGSVDDSLQALREELGITPPVIKQLKKPQTITEESKTPLVPDVADSGEEQDEFGFTPDEESRPGLKKVPVVSTTDNPAALRKEIGAAVLGLAQWAGFDARSDGSGAVALSDEGCGYLMQPLNPELDSVSLEAQIVWQLLAGLNGSYNPEYPSDTTILGMILGTSSLSECKALPDQNLNMLLDIIRLIRRLNSCDGTSTEAE